MAIKLETLLQSPEATPSPFIHPIDADGTRWTSNHMSWLHVKQGQGRWYDLPGEADCVTGGLSGLVQGKRSERDSAKERA